MKSRYLSSNLCLCIFLLLCSLNAAVADDDPLSSTSPLLPLIWSAPFLSGGGYCSEAISFALSLAPHYHSSSSSSSSPRSRLAIAQHGDSYNGAFVSGLDQTTFRTLQPLMQQSREWMKSDLADGLISVCHSEPGAWSLPKIGLGARYSTSRCPHPLATITIGRTMFETDRLPSGWDERLNAMDYIWIPTQFMKEIFRDGGVEEEKLVVIPEPVDTEFFSQENAQTLKKFKWPQEEEAQVSTATVTDADGTATSSTSSTTTPYRFVSIFKFEERKGWKILLEAFLREFSSTSNPEREVILYILTSAYHTAADFQKKIDEFISTLTWTDDAQPSYLPPIRLIPSGLSMNEMVSLYAAMDCFVLPSRGEGWGRPHAESMSMGKPVIATHWSGPSEFMTEENSYPLSHDKLVEITSGAFRGHQWAEPSQRHLRELMRHVVQDPEEAQKKGARAREDMRMHYCQECVANLVVKELKRVQQIVEEKVRATNTQPGTSELTEKQHDEL